MEHISLKSSIKDLDKLSFSEYTEWLDHLIKLNSQCALFYYVHIKAYINQYRSKLGFKEYIYLEKLFSVCLEMKLISEAENILFRFKSFFGSNETKIERLEADFIQTTQIKQEDEENNPIQTSLSIYKKLFKANQHDKISLKNYLYLSKIQFSYDELRKYIDLCNEYLKNYMDDVEIWQELAEVYIQTVNYSKAIFCLEEVILHSPNDYLTYIKIGDLLNSLNNTESSSQALKYYCKSINIQPTNRAFWGIIFIGNIYNKSTKPIEGQLKSCIEIAIKNIEKEYSNGYVEKLYGKLI